MGEGRETGLARIGRKQTWWRSRKGMTALLVLVILLGFALRLYRLGYQSIWYDEGVSIHLAMKDLRGLTLHTAGDIHPPFYYYLLHFWIRVVGPSEFSVAFLSLFFGMLIIPLTSRLASDLYGHRIGLLTAFLIAISPFNLWYSHEIRMYTLGAALGLISLHCLVRLVGVKAPTFLQGGVEDAGGRAGVTRSSIGLWTGYVLSSAAGLYSLYYFVFLLLFEGLFVLGWWLVSAWRKVKAPLRVVHWLVAQGAILLLYLPWLPIALRQALDPPVPPWRDFVGLGKLMLDSWSALALGQSVEPDSALIWPLLSFVFAIYLIGLLSPEVGLRRGASATLLCGYTFAPLLMIYLLSLRTPLFHVRYMFTYSPPFYLILALGFSRLASARRSAMALGLTVLAVACGYSIYSFHFDPRYAADDHRGAVDYMEGRIAPGDAVLINAGYAYPPFLYYYEGEIAWRGRLVDYDAPDLKKEGIVLLQTGVIGGDENLGWRNPLSDFYATSEEETLEALGRVFAHHSRVWVYRIYDTVNDPQGLIRDWLEEHGRVIGDTQFEGESYMRVQCYLTQPEPAYQGEITYHPLDVRLDGRISLLGYDGPEGVRAGDDVPLTLHWKTDVKLETDYNVLLLLGVRGWADFTRVEESPSPPTSQWQVGRVISQDISLEIPAGTPPTYWDLMLEMHDPDTRRVLAAVPDGYRMATILVNRPLVPPRPAHMTHEPWANFDNLLQLVGYDVEPLEVEAGDKMRAEFLWRVWDAPLPLIQMTIELKDGEHGSQGGEGDRHLIDRYPSFLWEEEELVRDVYELQVPQGLSSGRCQVMLTLERIKTAQQRESLPFLSASGAWEDSFVLGTVEVS